MCLYNYIYIYAHICVYIYINYVSIYKIIHTIKKYIIIIMYVKSSLPKSIFKNINYWVYVLK